MEAGSNPGTALRPSHVPEIGTVPGEEKKGAPRSKPVLTYKNSPPFPKNDVNDMYIYIYIEGIRLICRLHFGPKNQNSPSFIVKNGPEKWTP